MESLLEQKKKKRSNIVLEPTAILIIARESMLRMLRKRNKQKLKNRPETKNDQNASHQIITEARRFGSKMIARQSKKL